MEKIAGHLEIGTNGKGEVVVNHPELQPDAAGVGHIVFSPSQARAFAETMKRKADDADREKGLVRGDRALEIVRGIYKDLTGRAGLDLCNVDDEVKNEMLNKWYDIAERATTGRLSTIQNDLLARVMERASVIETEPAEVAAALACLDDGEVKDQALEIIEDFVPLLTQEQRKSFMAELLDHLCWRCGEVLPKWGTCPLCGASRR